jgi:hypothetical protein
MESDDKELDQLIDERFKLLPKVVQDAITSADVEKQLRRLADMHKLHLDQWEDLENQVMLTLLGIEDSDDLGKNIRDAIAVPQETAAALAADISKIVFEPIREQLERELGSPDAKAETTNAVEQVRTQVLAQEKAAAVAPATPPPQAPEQKVVRAPVSESYRAGETSASRKSVHDDPYRESPA